MGQIIPLKVEDELKVSYLDYAMSVIVSRALPDVRDGLKPVHRRILYAMKELGLTHNRPYRKSARVVGEVLGKYHPHGDTAVYDTMVRMAQDFSYRYVLLDGQGNFGSVDGDPPAAMRYTEIRMSSIGEEMLVDIDKDTVDWVPNFDNSLKEPTVLPSRIPNLLINGSSGIAVGMATNIPPHNIREMVDALVFLIDNPDATIEDIMMYLKAPDFPTGGIIYGGKGIVESYKTGRGKLTLRGRIVKEVSKGRERLIITEIPYGVNKSSLLEQIAEMVKERKIVGVTDLRDESDRRGMRVVIELRKGVNPDTVENQLYHHTSLQMTFGVILLALDNGEPKVFNIKQMMEKYVQFREEVIRRRSNYELRIAQQRAHIVEGLKKALEHIDEVIAVIKKSSSVSIARDRLMERFSFTEVQAQAILDMRLQRLTALEREKLEREYKELMDKIAYLSKVLSDRMEVLNIIKADLRDVAEKYGDKRRTEVRLDVQKVALRELIHKEDVVVTATKAGYLHVVPVSRYRKQRRGGVGSKGVVLKEEDFLVSVSATNTLADLLVFSDAGRVYKIKVYEIQQKQATRGMHVNRLFSMSESERIIAIKQMDYPEGGFVVILTRYGYIKKILQSEFKMINRAGKRIIRLNEGDVIEKVLFYHGDSKVCVVTGAGMIGVFEDRELRVLGRSAMGVRAVRLRKGDKVVGGGVFKTVGTLLLATENGFTKRVSLADFRVTHRGSVGVRGIRLTERSGRVIGAWIVDEDDEIMFLTRKGRMVRIEAKEVPLISRTSMGRITVRLTEDDEIVDVSVVKKDEDS
ncbi:MAG: DNA gyrase subunit A [Synergistetes bacterium]|nr:DNA gyrase subunit A [Synergistota bacterium]